MQRLKIAFTPSKQWGPNDLVIREAWQRFKWTRPDELRLTTLIRKIVRCPKLVMIPQPERRDVETLYVSTKSVTNTQVEGTLPVGPDGESKTTPIALRVTKSAP